MCVLFRIAYYIATYRSSLVTSSALIAIDGETCTHQTNLELKEIREQNKKEKI